MIVSCIQLSSGENYKHNLKKYLHFVKKSINKNADLILTPEMTSIVTDEKNKLLKNSYTMEGDLFIKETKFLCKKFKKWIPSGNIGEVEDVANAVVFLASDMASYIHGADIYIDGGYMNNTIQYDPRPKIKDK